MTLKLRHKLPETASAYQRNVFAWVERGEGSLTIDAVAGSGKTWMLVEAAKALVDLGQNVTVVSFTNEATQQLSRRMPRGVFCTNLHKAGNAAWRSSFRNVEVANGDIDNPSKVDRIITALVEHNGIPRNMPRGKIQAFVKMAKDEGLVPVGLLPGSLPMKGLVDDDIQEWYRLADHYGHDFDDDSQWSVGKIAEAARMVLRVSIRYAHKIIDCDDMLYMSALSSAATFPRYPWLMVDEVQDLSVLQRHMVAAMRQAAGRVIIVDDEYQTIYGWRGASVDSMSQMTSLLGAERLPLPVCYRCCKAVVRLAQKVVPHIEARPDAPEGEEKRLATWKASDVLPGDMVVCRNRAPAIKIGFRLLASGKPVRLMGGDTAAKPLIRFIESLAPRGSSLGELERSLDRWLDAKLKAAEDSEDEDAAGDARDLHDSIVTVIDGSGAASVRGVIDAIRELFAGDREGKVLVGTVHGAKGLEAERVFLLDEHLMPAKSAKLDWQIAQERNLWYVAVTRARNAIYFVTSDGWREEESENEDE